MQYAYFLIGYAENVSASCVVHALSAVSNVRNKVWLSHLYISCFLGITSCKLLRLRGRLVSVSISLES